MSGSTNLLLDSIVPIDLGDGRRRLTTLPGAFAAFAAGTARGFIGVRPHQRPGVHSFMVQAACLAIDLSGETSLDVDERTWGQRLRRMAPESAWRLIGVHSEDAAFLQPPMSHDDFDRMPAPSAKGFETPDDATVLVRSKNHFVKFSRMYDASPWDWALSLVELQTMGRYDGRDLYGTARMDGGYGSRFLVGIYPDLTPSSMWRRDVARVLRLIPDIRASVSAYGSGGEGIGALWTVPWDGGATESLSLEGLHPLFIDTCRRVRLFIGRDGRIQGSYLPSKGPRVAAKERRGVLGDPWVPLDMKGPSALTAKSVGIKLLRDLVIPDGDAYRRSLLQSIEPDDPEDLFFHLSVLIGDQGGTGGYHEVSIPIPGALRDTLFSDEGARLIGATANGMLADADKAANCLRVAVYALMQDGAEAIVWKNHAPSEAAKTAAGDEFRRAYSEEFFPSLWHLHETGDDRAWVTRLRSNAESILDRLSTAHGSKVQLGHKARAVSRAMFSARWAREFNKSEASQ